MEKFDFEIFKTSCNGFKPGAFIEIRQQNMTNKKAPNNDCYTSKDFIEGLLAGNNGELFDLDPASSKIADNYVKIAKNIFTKEDDGLISNWSEDNYVFLNPPFSEDLFLPFVRKMINHNNGILLVFEKVSTATKRLIEPNCSLIMKFKKRFQFVDINGEKCNLNYYITLYSFGKKAQRHLLNAKKHLKKWEPYLELPEAEIYRMVKEMEES